MSLPSPSPRHRVRALVTDGAGAVALRPVAPPAPGPGDVLVRATATSVNRGELRVVDGPSGTVPGWDVAGELLEEVPELGLAAGDPVVGLVDGGAWAERVAVPRRRLARIPDGVDHARAACLPVAGITALRAVRMGGSLLGRRVLVTGASGGVGRLAVQLAALAGADVTAVARRQDGLGDLGAGAVLADVTGAAGRFDLVLESVGGASLTAAFGVLAPGGTLVSIAATDPEPAAFAPRALFNGSSGARIIPWNVFDATETTGARDDLDVLLSLVGRGRLDPQLVEVAPWERAADVLGALRDRRVRGKAVLRMG